MKGRSRGPAKKSAAPATVMVPGVRTIVRDDGPAPQSNAMQGEATPEASRGPARKRRAKFVF
jgi:hypothetical protein